MAKILVIDDEAVIREPIAASLRAEGHLVVTAGNGDTGLTLARTTRPDVILLDIRMPDRDGISVLRELRASPLTAATPVLLLSGANDKDLIIQAAKLGAQSYMLKAAFSLGGLLERIKRFTETAVAANASASAPASPAPPPARAAAPVPSAPALALAAQKPPSAAKPVRKINPSAWPKILTREQTLERLEQVADGKTLAGVVAQLTSVANSPNADLSDVVRVIESDPVLAARVLQLANSASAGARGRIRNVEDAARNLGVRGIQNMAISIGIVGAFPPDEQDGFNSMRCWQHSYAVAELLNLLQHSKNSEQESLNHLIGLCHDLGDILLRQHFTKEYEQIAQFATENALPVPEVASVALSIRQPELASRLLTRIGLPTPVVYAIREFYERQVRGQAAGMSAGTQGLALANLAAHGLLLTPSLHESLRPITRTEWNLLSREKQPPTIDPAIRRSDILTATNILARLPAREEERLLQPPIPRRSVRIRYVRPATFIEFDPLAFALSLCSDLTISPELPPAEQWHTLDALVLVGIRPGIAPVLPEEIKKLAFRAGRAEPPILALTAQEAPPEINGSFVLRSYPITLADLAAWLAAIPSSQPAATSGELATAR